MDDVQPSRQVLFLIICISLLVHLALLLAPWHPLQIRKPPRRLDVSLPRETPAPVAQTDTPVAATPAAPEPLPQMLDPIPRPVPRERAVQRVPDTPAPARKEPAREERTFTQAERDDIDSFLQSLGPGQRRDAVSAREVGGAQAGGIDDNAISVERIPDSPPVNPTSMRAYINALTANIYRTADRMPRPRQQGRETALIALRINPDGSLNGVSVLAEGDQKAWVEHTRRVFERAAPYPVFPPAMAASVKVLTIKYCLVPDQESSDAASRVSRGLAC